MQIVNPADTKVTNHSGTKDLSTHQKLRVVDRQQPAIVVLYCDAVTTAIIGEALCLPVYALLDLEDLKAKAAAIEPLGFIVDAANSLEGRWIEALAIVAERWEFCTRLVLTRNGDDAQLESAFSNGCHDVIRKPLNSRELLARFHVRSEDLTARFKASGIRIADLTIVPVSRTVQTQKSRRQLSQTAFSMLLVLLEEPEKLITREVFKERVWLGTQVVDGVVDRHIHDIRKILNELESVVSIKSVYGEGFRLSTEAPEARLILKK